MCRNPLKLMLMIAVLGSLTICGPAYSQSTSTRLDSLEAKVARLEDRLDKLEKPSQTPAPAYQGSEHLRYGTPKTGDAMLDKKYFVIAYNPQLKIPDWVIYSVTSQQLAGSTQRTQDYRPDPDLQVGSRAELADYEGSGYDRGHMAPAAAFRRSKEATSTTFLLSNMAPQTGQLNSGKWLRLETRTRAKIKEDGRGWVVTGTAFLDDAMNLTAPSKFIGKDKVAVPTHCYKVILTERPGNLHSMYAFLVPNEESIPGQYTDYLYSVNDVERITGLDFFPGLPDAEEDSLEAMLPTDWLK